MRKLPGNYRAAASIPVLVVGSSAENGSILVDGCGFSATPCVDAGDALEIVLCDLDLHESGGKVLLNAICADFPGAAVIAITRPGKLRNGVLAMIAGASGYIQMPLHPATVVASLRGALRRKRLDSAVRGKTSPL